VGVGVAVGHWLDGRLGTEPWFLLAGGILTLGAALTYFFRKASDLSKRQGRNR
jgi:F0F1-type ATP synthase assembly protein I